jgi:hypothetical protein
MGCCASGYDDSYDNRSESLLRNPDGYVPPPAADDNIATFTTSDTSKYQRGQMFRNHGIIVSVIPDNRDAPYGRGPGKLQVNIQGLSIEDLRPAAAASTDVTGGTTGGTALFRTTNVAKYRQGAQFREDGVIVEISADNGQGTGPGMLRVQAPHQTQTAQDAPPVPPLPRLPPGEDQYGQPQAEPAAMAIGSLEDASFDPGSGAPINTPAKMMCIDMWESQLSQSVSAGEDHEGVPVVRQVFFKDVEEATDQWSEERNLGAGASCQVFSGVLFGRLGVAVKKLKVDLSEWDQRQFASEMALLCSVSHRNIVR